MGKDIKIFDINNRCLCDEPGVDEIVGFVKEAMFMGKLTQVGEPFFICTKCQKPYVNCDGFQKDLKDGVIS